MKDPQSFCFAQTVSSNFPSSLNSVSVTSSSSTPCNTSVSVVPQVGNSAPEQVQPNAASKTLTKSQENEEFRKALRQIVSRFDMSAERVQEQTRLVMTEMQTNEVANAMTNKLCCDDSWCYKFDAVEIQICIPSAANSTRLPRLGIEVDFAHTVSALAVTRVKTGSLAEQCGIRQRDLIFLINDKPVFHKFGRQKQNLTRHWNHIIKQSNINHVDLLIIPFPHNNRRYEDKVDIVKHEFQTKPKRNLASQQNQQQRQSSSSSI